MTDGSSVETFVAVVCFVETFVAVECFVETFAAVGGFVVVMVTDAADLPPHSVRAVQLGRREEVEEAVPLGPFGHDVAIAASLSN